MEFRGRQCDRFSSCLESVDQYVPRACLGCQMHIKRLVFHTTPWSTSDCAIVSLIVSWGEMTWVLSSDTAVIAINLVGHIFL